MLIWASPVTGSLLVMAPKPRRSGVCIVAGEVIDDGDLLQLQYSHISGAPSHGGGEFLFV